MGGGQLAVDHVRGRCGDTPSTRSRERHLRGIALAAEHRFAEEHPSQAHAVQPADQRVRRARSRRCAHGRRRCSSQIGGCISDVIQVPGLAARGAAQASMTAAKSRSNDHLKAADCAWSSPGCASSGIPRETAPRADRATTTAPAAPANTRERCRADRPRAAAAGDRSPPAASSPAGSSSACSERRKPLGRIAAGDSQVMVFTPAGPALRRLAVGDVRLHLVRIGSTAAPSLRKVVRDGRAKLRIGDVVRRPGERRLEAAAHLVLALGARLEASDAALDAELDALVVAGFEMQAVVVGGGAPVAAVQCVLSDEKDRRGNHGVRRCSASFTISASRQRAGDLAEERPCQVRLVAVAQEGVAMQFVHVIEERLIELADRDGFRNACRPRPRGGARAAPSCASRR